MSSRNESSGRRSSSRSSSRNKKSKSRNKKSAANDGANFWVMLAGFVAGLIALLLIVSLFASPEINSEMLESNDDNRAQVATRVESRDFDTFVENANVEQLAKTLKSLQDAPKINSEAQFLTNIQRQQLIVDSLLEKPLSDEDRRLAILARLKTTSTMFWTDQYKAVREADLGIRLREVAQTHADDSDPQIAFESRVQLAKLNSLVAMNQPGPFARELHQLLVDFPTNERVQKTILNRLNYLVINSEFRPATIKVLDQFLKLPKVNGNQGTENVYYLLRDLESLCEFNFFDHFENVQFTGEAGRNQLRDVCLDLAKVPAVGKEVLGNLDKSARWMETNGHYQHAIDIYNAMEMAGERLPDQKDVVIFNRLANWGRKRCEAVGKKFNLAANSYDGKPLRLSTFESMPVLIVFWSKSDKTESILFKVQGASQRWRRKSVKVVVVQVESDPENFVQRETSELTKLYKDWSFCYDDGSGRGPIFSQIPSRKNGRIALLDRKHQLDDVDVNLEELVTSVNAVLATRSSKN